MTEPLDLSAAATRRMARCAIRGHDWQPTDDGQCCTRCPMQIRSGQQHADRALLAENERLRDELNTVRSGNVVPRKPPYDRLYINWQRAEARLTALETVLGEVERGHHGYSSGPAYIVQIIRGRLATGQHDESRALLPVAAPFLQPASSPAIPLTETRCTPHTS